MIDAIIREALELPADFPLIPSDGPGTVPNWDSLGWVKIINLIEQKIGMELPLDKIGEASNVADLERIVSYLAPRP